ncbi:hypothetical protein EIP91_001204 [Steccherinum ochraceum]|uniref:Phosphoglycerate mutase n=1 Tax=Steccherinum ochraceum TaxID=92696 RepID=A0A4R0RSP2_9APHY|nr:hypothetical protein EIP91_001204 [Steccherinum ochraceum]
MTISPLLIITFVRHGESTDNLKSVWAGWKDAPLSNHGMNQARACGDALSSTRFKAIHASPLLRAFSTAQAIHAAQPDPKPTFTTSLLLREQHFGVAEGQPWEMTPKPHMTLPEQIAQGIYPVLHRREEKFPQGESLDDLSGRATEAVEACVMPHVREALRSGVKGGHVALVSHGLCISEMVPALLRKDARGVAPEDKYRGLMNTAWTRVTVDVPGWDGKALEFADNDLPPLIVKVTEFNRHEHLDKVTRQKGGIGSSAFDPKQKDIRAFFGGGKVEVDSAAGADEEGRSASNALDEADVQIQ